MRAATWIVGLLACMGLAQARQVEFHTQKIGEATHWVPETLKVKRGEKLEIEVSHKLAGGYDFHGFSIPQLKIEEQVFRNKPKKIQVTIPRDLKAGEYRIACQFHPAHVGASLVVE